ncbi:hypothetical protein BJ973_000144 [Actinoplanes tereljensis]|uniref:hypothetical protein n=1 Tax=Paractinoplanes tereljensis TaxID=571912 RepID=UPI00194078E0|nr:hypothetical protein [Actinoplanes tereljensis]
MELAPRLAGTSVRELPRPRLQHHRPRPRAPLRRCSREDGHPARDRRPDPRRRPHRGPRRDPAFSGHSGGYYTARGTRQIQPSAPGNDPAWQADLWTETERLLEPGTR